MQSQRRRRWAASACWENCGQKINLDDGSRGRRLDVSYQLLDEFRTICYVADDAEEVRYRLHQVWRLGVDRGVYLGQASRFEQKDYFKAQKVRLYMCLTGSALAGTAHSPTRHMLALPSEDQN